MAVDGALVLTATWDVIGFGAEIHGPSNRNEVVYRALDLEATELIEERADEAGTRHRAAYRLSCQHPECMITVVSQDGAVRYVGNVNGKVTYWELGPFKPRFRNSESSFSPSKIGAQVREKSCSNSSISCRSRARRAPQSVPRASARTRR